MALPNLSTLRCCPARTGTILTRAIAPDVCVICYAPLFGCANTVAGSDEDDWQTCNDPVHWRMRPDTADGQSMAVAVMRRCGKMVHVSCLLGWIDEKRAELGAENRTTFPCPWCSGQECVSAELLEDLEPFKPPELDLDAAWAALGVKVYNLDRVAQGLLNTRFFARELYNEIEIKRQAYSEWIFQINSNNDATLHGTYAEQFKAGRQRLGKDTFRTMKEVEYLYESAFVNRREFLNTYWDNRHAFNTHFPFDAPQRPPDDPTMLQRLEDFVESWETPLLGYKALADDASRQLWGATQKVPLDLELIQSLHAELLEKQRNDKPLTDLILQTPFIHRHAVSPTAQ
jgi:hypothetical protein